MAFQLLIQAKAKLSNLIQVCHRHHKLLHEGQFTVSRQANGTLVFKRPDGTIIDRNLSSNHTVPVQMPPLTHQHPWSACGDTMDYSVGVNGIAYANREAASRYLE